MGVRTFATAVGLETGGAKRAVDGLRLCFLGCFVSVAEDKRGSVAMSLGLLRAEPIVVFAKAGMACGNW